MHIYIGWLELRYVGLLLLLHAGSKGKGSLMVHELLYSMKNMCQMKRPEVSPSELGHSSFNYSASRIVF